MSLRLFVFDGAETDWVAANSEMEAWDELKSHYGITDEDIAGSYESITEADPSEVTFDTDMVNEKTEETITTTAAAIMAGRTRPFLVSSTYQ